MINRLLFIPLIGLFLYAFLQKRQYPAVSLAICVLAAIGTGFMFYPQALDKMAAYLDMERGTDLIFYLAIMLGAVAIFNLHLKFRKVNAALTAVARFVAIEQAKSEPTVQLDLPQNQGRTSSVG